MPAIRIPPGVVRGDSRASVPGRWHTTSLVRWHEGAMVPVGGWERLTPVPLASPGRAGHVWLDKTFKKYTAVLCDAHCYVERNNNRRNITPPDFANANAAQRARGYGSGDYGLGLYGNDQEPRDNDGGSDGSDKAEYSFPVAFSLDNWDDDLLFGSSADGRVWVWNPENPNDPAVVCANAPLLSQAFLATEEHHLMVLGGGGFPNRVAWSDVNNREGWDFTRVEGQAGFFDLDGAGTILTARKIPGGVLIFTVTSVWICTYIGTPNYYGFKKLAEHNAPLSPQAVTVALGKAVWMSRRGFWKYEGGVVVPLPCSLGVEPFEEIDTYAAPRRVCSGYNAAYPEIWFFYPTKGRGELPENNRYIIYNLVDNWWADGILNRTFFTSSPIDGVPFGGGPAGNIFQHETGWLNEGQPRLKEVFAEVSNLSFDDGDSNWTVTRGQIDGRRTKGSVGVVPVQPNSVRMTFTGSRVRGGEQKPLGAWTARADGWMDCRFTAKDFSFRVEGLVDAPWSFGATNFTVVARGQR